MLQPRGQRERGCLQALQVALARQGDGEGGGVAGQDLFAIKRRSNADAADRSLEARRRRRQGIDLEGHRVGPPADLLQGREERSEGAHLRHPHSQVDLDRLDGDGAGSEREKSPLEQGDAPVALAALLDHVGPQALRQLELAHPEAAECRQAPGVHRVDVALGIEVDGVGHLLADVGVLGRRRGAQEQLRTGRLRDRPPPAKHVLERIRNAGERRVRAPRWDRSRGLLLDGDLLIGEREELSFRLDGESAHARGSRRLGSQLPAHRDAARGGAVDPAEALRARRAADDFQILEIEVRLRRDSRHAGRAHLDGEQGDLLDADAIRLQSRFDLDLRGARGIAERRDGQAGEEEAIRSHQSRSPLALRRVRRAACALRC